MGFQRALRTDPKLGEIARDFYSDLPALADPTTDWCRRAELHMMEQALQMIGDTWERLGLCGSDDAPINRGWMNAFRRISGSEAFRRYWPLLRSEFRADFVRFCEQQLGARVPEPVLIPAETRPDLVDHLGAELAREWPEVVRRDSIHSESLAEAGARHLHTQVVARAVHLEAARAAWVIVQYPVQYEKSKDPDIEIPLGLLAVVPVDQANNSYELFLWIVRAQRSIGVGEKVRKRRETRDIIDWLSAKRATVRVRYPKTPWIGGEDLNRIRWLSFFSLFGFKPEGEPDPEEFRVLSRKYP
ncbi:MAG: hypothetical protein JO034_21625 [Singulisphaera sp.]|nr:hypothetical protein [Singulisphaera sp.]